MSAIDEGDEGEVFEDANPFESKRGEQTAVAAPLQERQPGWSRQRSQAKGKQHGSHDP